MNKNMLNFMPSVLALAIGMGLPAAQAGVVTDAAVVGSHSVLSYLHRLCSFARGPMQL